MSRGLWRVNGVWLTVTLGYVAWAAFDVGFLTFYGFLPVADGQSGFFSGFLAGSKEDMAKKA
ncbi:MAG: hypothetical protein ACOWWM_05820 [Desulfobacterales bacterium]